jgi:pSer/pThr/pTyr-binding forkhead associated (FHA) protein
MVQLRILSGKKAGTSWVARRFPVRIGRAPSADLQVEEEGVWDQHLQIELQRGEGFHLKSHTEAPALVNGEAVQEAALRNGDCIQLGSLKLQFWLSETRQVGLGFREWLTWLGIAAVSLVQIGLIYWLLR